jgi:predicted nucleotidyltransferase
MLLDRETILKFLKEHKEMFKSKYQIKKLGLFGNYAK